jgi:hypothetical protein
MEERLLPQKLGEWTTSIAQSQLLGELRGRGEQTGKLYPSKIDQNLQINLDGPLNLRVLPKAYVQIWRDCIRVIEKAGKKNINVIRKQLSDVFLSESSVEYLCKMHQMTINVPTLTEREDFSSWLDELNRSSVELLLNDEYDGLLLSISELVSTLNSGNGPNLTIFSSQSPPSISISLQEGKLIMAINPQTCTYGCTSSTSDNDAINSVVLSQSGQSKRAKLARSSEVVNEVLNGPLCKAVVHQVENGTSIEVAASSIEVAASSAESPLLSATGRPHRSCKARGDYDMELQRQERGFQGTFLQSTQFDTQASIPKSNEVDDRDCTVTTELEYSTDNVEDIVDKTIDEDEYMTNNVESTEVNVHTATARDTISMCWEYTILFLSTN